MARSSSAGSREQIVRAALAHTSEDGWDATSLQAVRLRAGVSNGTLFHYFPTREALAGAVIAAGLSDHQAELSAELRAAASPRDGVERVVARHLGWMQEYQPLARLFLMTPREALRAGLDEGAVADNQRFFRDVEAWLGDHGWSGVPDLAVVLALWIGPAQEYARHHLSGPSCDLAVAAAELAAGAWHALRSMLDHPMEA
jgi:AcrR family transcriptional regulator